LSCKPEGNSNSGFIFDEITFMSNWDSWNNQNIKNYSFNLSTNEPVQARFSPILFGVNIIVRNGLMESYEYIFNETGLETPIYTSICDMFQKIYDFAIENKSDWKNVDYLISETWNIKFNESLNYITIFSGEYKWKSTVPPFFYFVSHYISDFKIID